MNGKFNNMEHMELTIGTRLSIVTFNALSYEVDICPLP
jgi:hypothetical protein